MNIEELKKIVRGNGFQESHGSTTIVIDVETVVDLLDELKQCDIHGVIKRIEEYAPKPIELPEFDLTKKTDYVYCVEWGMKKAKRNEFEVYQKMLKELKEKYVL